MIVEKDTIQSVELVEASGGYLPKIGESFSAYCSKVRIAPMDITPDTQRHETIFTMDKMDVSGWVGLFGNPCRGQVR